MTTRRALSAFSAGSVALPLAGLGLIIAAFAPGCGASSDSSDDAGTPPATATASILDEYEATGEIPNEEGAITKIAFLDETTYALKKTTGSTDGEQIAPEWGTYKIEGGTLILTDDATGIPRSLPFSASSSDVGEEVHVLGGTSLTGGSSTSLTSGSSTSLTYTLTCTITINGLSFKGMNISCSLTSSGGSGSGSGTSLTSGGSSGMALTSGSGSGTSLTSVGSSGVNLGGSSSGGTQTGGGSSGGTQTGGGSSNGGTSLGGSPDAGMMDGGLALSSTAAGQGIDVSHWDGTINWSQVKAAGKGYGYAKASESTGYTDNTFVKNYAGMRAAGIKPGGYHFFNATSNPTSQAMHFVSVLKSAGFNASTDLPPALDLEAVPGLGTSSAAAMKTFVSVVQQQLGLTITIYTDSGDWARIGNPNMASNPLWIAYVNKGGAMSTASAPRMPPGWSSYAIWQNSWVGKVSGINAKVDLDYAPLVAGSN